jgi:hypothetical protein
MWQEQRNSRRGFIRAATVTLVGGSAALVASDAAVRLRPSSGRTYAALVETVASMRRGGDVGLAQRRLSARYAASDLHERVEIEGALKAVEDLPGGPFAEHPVAHRLSVLAEHLPGPQGNRITAALGLAVNGLADSDQRDLAAAGRLYARMISALAAHPAAEANLRSAATATCATPNASTPNA